MRIKRRLKLFFIIAIIIGSFSAKGQQLPMYTQYMWNTISVNPAYAGTKDYLSAMVLGRKQWWGFPGAPTTETFSINAPIKKQRIGLGLSVVNDQIGPINETGFFLDFSFRFRITEKGWLSLGAKGGVSMYNCNLNKIKTIDVNDPNFTTDVKAGFIPNIGAGVYYFTDKYYIGLSTPKLVSSEISMDSEVSTSALGKEKRHYYFIGGYVFDIGKSTKFKPTVLAKYVQGSPVSLDLTASFLLRERLWLGASLRVNESIGFMAEYAVTKQLWLGYAYDVSIHKSRNFHGGSHEILITYDFIFDKFKVKSPRYF